MLFLRRIILFPPEFHPHRTPCAYLPYMGASIRSSVECQARCLHHFQRVPPANDTETSFGRTPFTLIRLLVCCDVTSISCMVHLELGIQLSFSCTCFPRAGVVFYWYLMYAVCQSNPPKVDHFYRTDLAHSYPTVAGYFILHSHCPPRPACVCCLLCRSPAPGICASSERCACPSDRLELILFSARNLNIHKINPVSNVTQKEVTKSKYTVFAGRR